MGVEEPASALWDAEGRDLLENLVHAIAGEAVPEAHAPVVGAQLQLELPAALSAEEQRLLAGPAHDLAALAVEERIAILHDASLGGGDEGRALRRRTGPRDAGPRPTRPPPRTAGLSPRASRDR